MQFLDLLLFMFALSDVVSTKESCPSQFFKLHGMVKCRQLLDCSDVKDLRLGEVVGKGSTKLVHLAKWKEFDVAVSLILNKEFTADFDHGLDMLLKLSPNQYVVQLVGFCKNPRILITEFHKLGNASGILSIVERKYGRSNIIAPLRLCFNYARILELLHDGPAGTRVMCDSNDLAKLLSQMLVTDDCGLVLNDLDALPLVDNASGLKVVCGYRQLSGDFIAPEQKWPYKVPFRPAAMPRYDEKTDIWKAADVFKFFISNVDESYDWLHYRLFSLFRNCKNPDPNLRPTAKYLASALEKILAEVSLAKTEL